jgi:predicted transposase/invertase (TIGR01784 family)
MRRDVIFYQIFQRFPSLLFEFVEHPPAEAQRYRFESVEVKEASFRIDGVFLPPEDAVSKTVFFAEIQFQKDEDLYHRLIAESMLYLYRNRTVYRDWYAVVIFPSRSLEPEDRTMHRSLLNGDQMRRIYLDELGEPNQQPVGVSLMQLTTPCGHLEEHAPEERAVEQARELIARAQSEEGGRLDRGAIMEMVTTIAVYKFTHLSREEVETMLGLQLEDSRILREAKAEGRQEGRQEGEREKALAIVLRQLTRRVGVLEERLQARVRQLGGWRCTRCRMLGRSRGERGDL